MLRSFEVKIFSHRDIQRTKKYFVYFQDDGFPVGKKISSKPYKSLSATACASRAYLQQLLPHPEQLPQQPEQPPFARDLSMERTAASTIAASTLKTIISPMTVTSYMGITFDRQKN